MTCKKVLEHLTKCNDCFETFRGFVVSEMAKHAGHGTSAMKAKSSRLNGQKGGRPKKNRLEGDDAEFERLLRGE